MARMTPEAEAWLRRLFRRGNQLMLLIWRLGLGQLVNAWPAGTGRILVLGHTGRRSGLRRRTPLNYALVGDEIYVVAGFGAGSDWYRNLKARPRAEVWLPVGRWETVAEELPDDDPCRPELLRAVLRASGLVAPLLGLDPARASDDELAAFTATYRLLRLRRLRPGAGAGGPGDLGWVWPALSLLAVAWAYGAWLRASSRRNRPLA